MSPEAFSSEAAAGSREENASRQEVGRPQRWHPALVALHWLTLVLIVAQFLIAGPMRDETRNLIERFELYQLHKSIGLTVAGFVAARLLLRLIVKAPPPANDGLLRLASDAVHAGLYLCVIALPVTGLLLAAASPIQIPTLYFGLFQVPHPIGPDKAAYELMLHLHDWAGNILLALGAVHFGATLTHVVFWRDNLLRRMWFSPSPPAPPL